MTKVGRIGQKMIFLVFDCFIAKNVKKGSKNANVENRK